MHIQNTDNSLNFKVKKDNAFWQKLSSLIPFCTGVLLFCVAVCAQAEETKVYDAFSFTRENNLWGTISHELGGFKNESTQRRFVGQGHEVGLSYFESIFSNYNLDQVAATQENGLTFSYTFEKKFKTQLKIYNTKQDIKKVSNEILDSSYDHRVTEISEKWMMRLNPKMHLNVWGGAAGCSKVEQSRTYGLFGVELGFAHRFFQSKVLIEQSVDGNGFLSGIYGGQLRQEAKISNFLTLGKKVKIVFSSSLQRNKGVFQNKNLLNEAPVVLHQARMDVALVKGVSASIDYVHRRILTHNHFDKHGAEGSLVSASLSYNVF